MYGCQTIYILEYAKDVWGQTSSEDGYFQAVFL